LLSLAHATIDGTPPPPLETFAAWWRNVALGPLLLWHAIARRLPRPSVETSSVNPHLPRETLDMPHGIEQELTDAEKIRFDSDEFDDPELEP
ncbi:MAG: hypothetical protein AAFQ82_05080, partial [Myxococcota bacterium]